MIRAYENPLVFLNKAGYETLISEKGYVRGGRLTSHHSKVDHTTKTSACGCAAKAIAAITRWKTESLRFPQSFPWSGKEHPKGTSVTFDLGHVWDRNE